MSQNDNKRRGHVAYDPYGYPYEPLPPMPTDKEMRDLFGIDATDYDKWRKETAQSQMPSGLKRMVKRYGDNDSIVLGPERGISFGDPIFDEFTECQHEYVDAGFRFSKIVCKKCDKEKT